MIFPRSIVAISLLAAMGLPGATLGADYYVSPQGDAANSATLQSPWPLEKANAQARAGDRVVLLDGVYDKPIAPASNGEKDNPLIFKALGAKAVFQGAALEKQEAIVLSGRAYIVIDGITIKGARRFILAEGQATHRITIQNCWFENASQGSWESCRFRDVGDEIRVTHCHLTGGNDLLAITGGKQHLVENNFFGDASHTGLVLIMAQQSVVRGNRFTNHQGKMMEVFNTREVKEPHRLSEYNLIEDNFFDTSPESGIQYAGSRSILRRNIFRRCNVGMEWANYLGRAKNPEAWYGESNRFYNNVLYECGPAKASASGVAMHFQTNRIPPTHYGDQLCINNIIYHNAGGGDKTAATAQISFNWDATPAFGLFFHNDILADAAGDPVIYWLDAPHEKPPVKRNMTLREWEERYPANAASNLEADPQFVDPANGDFHLKPTSPCIDAGGPLTTVRADSKGQLIKVGDALFFTDGHGIQGVEGDLIRVGGQKARVIGVDYQIKELVLDRAIQCTAGAAVNLEFRGRGPDMGAFELR